MTGGDYEFDGLPIDPVRPGSTVLVAGSSHAGTRQLALRMLAGADDEAVILVTTNARASRLIDDCRNAGIDVDDGRLGIVDCVGSETEGLPATVSTAYGPDDLTGIGMRFSKFYQDFYHGGYERIRSGFVSVSTMLSFSELRTVSRFVHTIVGRIDSVGGLGVLVVDPASHDDRTVSTVAQFCDGYLEVREDETEGPQLRLRGFSGHDRSWRSVDL